MYYTVLSDDDAIVYMTQTEAEQLGIFGVIIDDSLDRIIDQLFPSKKGRRNVYHNIVTEALRKEMVKQGYLSAEKAAKLEYQVYIHYLSVAEAAAEVFYEGDEEADVFYAKAIETSNIARLLSLSASDDEHNSPRK